MANRGVQRLVAVTALLFLGALAANSNALAALQGLVPTRAIAHEQPRTVDAVLVDDVTQPKPAGISGGRSFDITDLPVASIVLAALLPAWWVLVAAVRIFAGRPRRTATERAPPALL